MREAPPAAADVEHALAGRERELRADQLELLLLRLLERRRAAREERAAVGHRRAQEQLEELRRQVVVVAHRARVARAAVAAAPRAQLRGGRSRRQVQAGGPGRGEQQPRPCAAVERRGLPAVEHLEGGVEVVDLQLARHVGAPHAELPGSPQRVRDGRRGADDGRSGPPPLVEASCVPSHRDTEKGRSGSARSSSVTQRSCARERHARMVRLS